MAKNIVILIGNRNSSAELANTHPLLEQPTRIAPMKKFAIAMLMRSYPHHFELSWVYIFSLLIFF